jgi:hypothetical protein
MHEYYQRIGQLSEQERVQMLRAFDRLLSQIPLRPRRTAERELRELREARRPGGGSRRPRSRDRAGYIRID